MDYSYSSAISIAKTYILKKYSYMHPSEFLNLWIFNVYLVTCSLLFKTYFIKKKEIFFSFRKLRTCSYFVFNSFLHQSLSRNKTRNTGKWTTTKKWRPGLLQVNGYTADDYCAMILMIERFIINLTLAGHF